LLLASALFFVAAYFAMRFQDLPGASVGSYLSTLLIALPSFVALFRYLGKSRAVLSLLVLTAFGFTIEMVGVVTGLPYGRFYYGDALGEKVFGLVPYLLPVSYVPLVIGAVAAAWNIAGNRRVLWTLLSAVLLVLIDGVLDPGAAALGFWVWPEGGVYYGVPSSNYAGWLLSGVMASALLLAAGRPSGAPPPGTLDSTILALSFWTGVAVFSALIFPAALGAALLAFLFFRRLTLRERQLGKATPGAGGV
jgi:bisanhydrobacterioruberin hydratase